MPVISGKPTLFASRRSTALVAACLAIIALGVLPPALGRTASVSFANRFTIMTGFGCLDFVWTSWPSAPPAWRTVATSTDRTRRGQLEWAPALRTSHADSGPVHHALSLPFWILLIPAAALAFIAARSPAPNPAR